MEYIYDLIKNNFAISNAPALINKKLVDENRPNSRYCKLYLNYKRLLDRYLASKFMLKKYDDKIINSNLKFLPVKQEDMDYYQYMSTLDLTYIYLRNNLYVEKLSADDIEKIVNLTEDELNNPPKEITKLIENTYSQVINCAKNQGEKIVCCYGPDFDTYWIDSSELVFGIRHDDFGANGIDDDDEWDENNNQQVSFLNDLIKEMTDECSKINNGKVNFIKYHEFTVTKLNDNAKTSERNL